MTTQPRSDRHLPDILEGLYLGSTPAYRDDVLAHATRSRQRPAWTFPGRWFPMVELARQPAVVKHVPWRTLAVAVLTLILIAAGLAAYVGSRTHVPPPFGPAKNGLIAYSAGDSAYVVDPTTDAVRRIASLGASVVAEDPIYSPDGTRVLLSSHMEGPSTGLGLLWMVNADGSGLKQLTPEPMQDLTAGAFAPDGRSLWIVSAVAGTQSISIMNLDGSSVHTLDLGVPVGSIAFQPPDGKQILFVGNPDSVHNGELYLVNTDGTNLRRLASSQYRLYSDAVWSPDGSQIAYGMDGKVHIVAADGTRDRILDTGAGWKGWPKWSPDGTRIVVHGNNGSIGDASVVRVDGAGPNVHIATTVGPSGLAYEWSPDSTVIYARTFDDPQHQELWDPVTGVSREVPWSASTNPTWQRLAP